MLWEKMVSIAQGNVGVVLDAINLLPSKKYLSFGPVPGRAEQVSIIRI